MRPDVSPDHKWRVVKEYLSQDFPTYPVIRLYLAQNNKLIRDLVANEDLVFKSNPRWSSDSKKIIFQATQAYTQVDKEGRAREVSNVGIWSVDTDGKNLRHLVTNAQLIAVL